ncbi:MAG: enoyl-CoA hydratase/isomerase family protein [Planctomycetes bacterium]|nr:enoyl-CoA hydratase/isomerase family protein [Planctomycetota bacterium]
MHTIQMAHPGKNALSTALMTWLDAELDRAGNAPILLTGTDDAFCAGLDLKEVASLDTAGMERFLRHIDRIAMRLFDHPAPVVAAINGHAIAGGAVLALCCDWRVATTNPRTRIGVNEVALGACFPPRILKIVLHRISAHNRARVLLGAHLYPPEEARALGLVDELADDAIAAATKRLGELSAHPRAAYAHTKGLLRRGVTTLAPEDERRFADVELPQWLSKDVKAKIDAVLKR